MPIRILDASVVGRIAAGEVVERPSSVAKELIENSLDAGATAVTVEIRGGGIEYLRVTDNGCGIEPGQVRLAFENHATSKLQTAAQLDDIRTLGFRGEALPSIAAVSKIEMNTHAAGQESGIRLTVEGGQNMQTKEAGCPQGTTIIMRELFYNVPVRRAFLKKPSYEAGLVSDVVTRLMLGNPQISMRFISGGSTLYHSFGDGNLRHTVFAVYGRETAEKMIEIDSFEGGVRLKGLIGIGELAKATRSHQMFFINGRSVRCALLSKALERVCRSRVTIGMYPMCVLSLTIPPTGVDVNVHPNKLEVRFRDEDYMQTACEKILATAFEGERVLDITKEVTQKPVVNKVAVVREIPLPEVKASQPQEPFDKFINEPGVKKNEKTPVSREEKPQQTQMSLNVENPIRPAVLRENTFDRNTEDQVRTVELPERRTGSVQNKNNETAAPLRTQEPEQNAVPIAKQTIAKTEETIPPYRIIGVAFKTYILIETENTMLMIDQHAAHERIQYERFMARAEEGTLSQQLLTPIVVRLSGKEMSVVSDNLDTLEAAGFHVEVFGENEIRIESVPFVLGKAENKPVFLDMLKSLSGLKAATLDERRMEIATMACKSAVKGGDELTESEIRALIAEMLKTKASPTCPHGRPVVRSMKKSDLEKLFKRIQ